MCLTRIAVMGDSNERIKKLIHYWKDGSDKDFKSAQNIATKTKEYVSSLFLIHLSLEKCLKACYVSKFQTDAPFTHNLLHLAAKIDLQIEEIDLLTEINDFNLRCRYPDEKFLIYKSATKAKVNKMLKNTEEFRRWIFQKLN